MFPWLTDEQPVVAVLLVMLSNERFARQSPKQALRSMFSRLIRRVTSLQQRHFILGHLQLLM